MHGKERGLRVLLHLENSAVGALETKRLSVGRLPGTPSSKLNSESGES